MQICYNHFIIADGFRRRILLVVDFYKKFIKIQNSTTCSIMSSNTKKKLLLILTQWSK